MQNHEQTVPTLLYHLTKPEHVGNIMENGLEPKIGENSKLTGENIPRIYLTDRKSLPYWQIILGPEYKARLAVSTASIPPEHIHPHNYGLYKEYLVSTAIPPQDMSKTQYTRRPNNNHMANLCIDYLYVLSRLLVSCAAYYTEEKDMHEQLQYGIPGVTRVLRNLDYDTAPVEKIMKILKDEGEDGEYTLCDTYVSTGIQLWQMLPLYPRDDLYEARMTLHECIRTKLPTDEITKLNTGSWTGYENKPFWETRNQPKPENI